MEYPSVSLIIPCYNESIRVAKMIDGFKEFITFENIKIINGNVDYLVMRTILKEDGFIFA